MNSVLSIRTLILILAGAWFYIDGAVAQSPATPAEPEALHTPAPTGVAGAEAVATSRPPTAVLRFDQAQQEAVDHMPTPLAGMPADTVVDARPFAFKLNRKRVDELQAYDAVTLWNVRKVRIKNRRMCLPDSCLRQKVRLVKFFIERDRKKGVRPHLLGNVAGYMWASGIYDRQTKRFRELPKHISRYTLRDEYEAFRKATGEEVSATVPDSLWHALSPDAVYLLDGERVSGAVFQFIDGLILRTLDAYTGARAAARYEGASALIVGDTYPGRVPLVIFKGVLTSVETWLKLGRAGVFAPNSASQMNYFYMFPVEAVQYYGLSGKYGAIHIESVE